jgi:hypothetical protein
MSTTMVPRFDVSEGFANLSLFLFNSAAIMLHALGDVGRLAWVVDVHAR